MGDSQEHVTFPGSALKVALPGGWTVVCKGERLEAISPESDLRVSFVARAMDTSVEQCVGLAWQEVRPGFDVPVLQKVEMPGKDGWEKEITIAYDASGSESRVLFAVARVLGDEAYVTLVDGTKAGFSRRMAQFSELHSGWKPEGLKEPSLAGIVPKRFLAEEREALSSFVEWAMQQVGVPGMAMAVVQEDQTVYAEGFGVCRVGGAELVRAETRFMIGSSTKPLTTMMMAKLVDRGRFTWSTPIAEVLPGFALADADVTRRLEMRHTVCACTGMPRRDLDLVFRFRGVQPEDRIAEMREMKPTTGFGETFQYSNYLVAAGGYAAAHSYAPHVPLQDAYGRAMSELVFEPLGMKRSSVLRVESAWDAAPHSRDLDGNTLAFDAAIEGFADAVAPAGSVWSSVLDMAEYLKCEMAVGRNGRGDEVVSAENLLARRRPAIKIDGKTSYGMGLLLKDHQGLVEIGHGGNTRGFTAEMFFLPEHRIGVVMLTNLRLANQFLAAVSQRLLELLFGVVSSAEAMVTAEKRMLDDSTRVSGRRVKTDAESTAWLRRFVGHYVSQALGSARIREDEDGLRIELEAGSSRLAVDEGWGGQREIVLTTAPWAGVKLQASDDMKVLMLDGGQTKYEFVRVEG